MAPVGRPRTRIASTGARAPTSELGAVTHGSGGLGGQLAAWNTFVDETEFVPELVWPNSVQTYERMRADAQISSLFHATMLGIMRFKWSIDPNEADDAMVQKISDDYNLPILGEQDDENTRPVGRRKNRFQFQDHQRKAFYAGIWGHYYFEQVGDIGDDGLWHLRKLAERPCRTIQEFRIADDGGLVSIVQNVQKSGVTWGDVPEIPVDNLVGYVWDKEGANWVGRSWFREIFKNWVIKDRLMRIDAINHERAGGVPYIEAQPGATFSEIDKLGEMAAKFRIGDTSGGAVPAGAKVNIAKGTNSSVVDSIRYHDEAMARRFLLMVMQLGQTRTGSRALGESFIDFWADGLASIADWFKDTFNEHVIEDDIDWNYGEDVDVVPLLTYEFDPEFIVQDLALAVEKNIIVMDDELESYARKEMGLTEKGEPRLTPQEELAAEQAEKQFELDKKVAEKPPAAPPSGSQQPGRAAAGLGEGAPSRQPAVASTKEGE